ncbi:F-box protein [Melia azedarach]|uniref:F-box protein n=1 Tax=Melia azedarach TaxID=155640 RepID=A0ACC1XZ33_MELAZ|nr:F-box protein [Melia azedarach]
MSDYIPEEILVEIFLRLPPKSLAEFRRVCKSWYSLIDDPDFISKYNLLRMKNVDNSKLIMRQYDKCNKHELFQLYQDQLDSFSAFKAIDFPLDKERAPYQIIGLCCGLATFIGFPVRGVAKCIVIWNPSLGSCVRIPAKYFPNIHSEPFYGFGFDPKTTDYKIVRVVFREGHSVPIRPRTYFVDVFALKVGNWKDITATVVPPCVFADKTPQAYVNGAIHWVGHDERGLGFWRRTVLAVFDLSEEVFKEFDIPNEVKTREVAYEKMQKLFVGVFDQTLALMHYYTQWYNSPSYDGCCIWMMKEYGVVDSWTKQFKIDLRLGLGKMVGLRKNGEVLLVTRYNGELVSYDTKRRKFQKLDTFCIDSSFYLDIYMESLVLMKRVNWCFTDA